MKLAPPQVTEALKIIGAKRMPDDGDPHSREFVEIPVNGPREVERAMMWLRRACRLGRTAAGPLPFRRNSVEEPTALSAPRARTLWRIGALLMVAAVLSVTLGTGGRRSFEPFSMCLLCGERGSADAILNFILFIPLGFALGRGFGWRPATLALPILLTVAIELSQTMIPGRYPTLSDILTNGSGGLTGLWLALPGRGLDRIIRSMLGGGVGGRVFALCAAALILPAILMIPLTPDSTYWTQRSPALGFMERYRGEVDEGLTVTTDRAMPRSMVRRANMPGSKPLPLARVARKRKLRVLAST